MEDQRGVREAKRVDRDVRALMRGIQLALRAAVAAGLSQAIAELLKLKYPTIYSLIAAAIVTVLSPSQTSKLGHGTDPWYYAFYRLFETLLGIGVASPIRFVSNLVRVGEGTSVGSQN